MSVIPVSQQCKEAWPSDSELAAAYVGMAEDEQREQEAREWSENLIGDVCLDSGREAE